MSRVPWWKRFPDLPPPTEPFRLVRQQPGRKSYRTLCHKCGETIGEGFMVERARAGGVHQLLCFDCSRHLGFDPHRHPAIGGMP